ncbi:hypothetical protein LTR95_010614 [Oleoguttula sp. CCFEE 5521]
MVDALIHQGADVNKVTQGCGRPLTAAAKEGHAEVIKVLLEAGAQTDQRDKYHSHATALYTASARGHVEAVNVLLDAGAQVEKPSGELGTALQAAAHRSDNLCVLKVLLERGADPDPVHSAQCTPLQLASQSGSVENAEILINAGAKIERTSERDPRTALQIAADFDSNLFGSELEQLLQYWTEPKRAATRPKRTSMNSLYREDVDQGDPPVPPYRALSPRPKTNSSERAKSGETRAKRALGGALPMSPLRNEISR